MTELRELTDAELDIVAGGAMRPTAPKPMEPIIVKLVEEIVIDILKVLEGDAGRQKAYTA